MAKNPTELATPRNGSPAGTAPDNSSRFTSGVVRRPTQLGIPTPSPGLAARPETSTDPARSSSPTLSAMDAPLSRNVARASGGIRLPRIPRVLTRPEGFDETSLDQREDALLARIDGLTSEPELARALAWEDEDLAEVLARLVRQKLVTAR